MKKIGFLFMTAFLLILTSCSNPEKRAQEIVNDFETKIKEVGFEIKNSTFRDLLDKYKTDLEDRQIESLVNEKLADILNKKLEEYVLKINISKKIGSGNVGSFLEMQEAGPLNIKAKDGELRIPFEAVLKEPYSLSFEYDFTTLGAQLLDDNGNELDDNGSCNLDFEKLINNQSQSEKGEIVFSLEKIQGYGSTKNLIKKYIENIEKLNDIKDVNLKINRGKGTTGVAAPNPIEEGEVTPEESDVKLSDTECDEFLEEFDGFADEYVAFTKKYKKNPKDPSLVNEALELDAQIADWEKKSLQYGDCKDADFIKRLAGIQSKLTSAATNLFK